MRKHYNNSKVAEKSNRFGTVCKNSFFSSPVNGMRLVGHRRRRLISGAAMLVLTPLLVGVIYASAATQTGAQQQEYEAVHVIAPENEKAPLSRIEETSYFSVIPYETITVSDSELLRGETRVIVEGRDGVRRITELHVYEGDTLARVTAAESTIVREAIAETIAVGTADLPSTESTGSYIWPAEGVMSSSFGKRSLDIGSSNHEGIDLAGNRGDSIYAADGGEVILADSSVSGYGLLVKIQHDDGDVTYYGHCDELLVEAGERVYQGQEIAKMGSTGLSSGVHLHFEIRKNGSPVNPTKYLP